MNEKASLYMMMSITGPRDYRNIDVCVTMFL
jgi:hypothetical protein